MAFWRGVQVLAFRDGTSPIDAASVLRQDHQLLPRPPRALPALVPHPRLPDRHDPPDHQRPGLLGRTQHGPGTRRPRRQTSPPRLHRDLQPNPPAGLASRRTTITTTTSRHGPASARRRRRAAMTTREQELALAQRVQRLVADPRVTGALLALRGTTGRSVTDEAVPRPPEPGCVWPGNRGRSSRETDTCGRRSARPPLIGSDWNWGRPDEPMAASSSPRPRWTCRWPCVSTSPQEQCGVSPPRCRTTGHYWNVIAYHVHHHREVRVSRVCRNSATTSGFRHSCRHLTHS